MSTTRKNVNSNKAYIGHVSSPNCKLISFVSALTSTLTGLLRELRLELNISEKSFWDLTYPAFFPSPPRGLKSQGEAVWYFYLAEIALRRLGNRILNYIYRYKYSAASDPDINQAISNFEDQAEGWYATVSSHYD